MAADEPNNSLSPEYGRYGGSSGASRPGRTRERVKGFAGRMTDLAATLSCWRGVGLVGVLCLGVAGLMVAFLLFDLLIEIGKGRNYFGIWACVEYLLISLAVAGVAFALAAWLRGRDTAIGSESTTEQER